MTPEEEKLFDDLQFPACPTEEAEPFFWRWTDEGEAILKSFIAKIVHQRAKTEREKVSKEFLALAADIDRQGLDQAKEIAREEGRREAREALLKEIIEWVEKLIDSNDDGMWMGRETADKILDFLYSKTNKEDTS